MPDDVVLRCGLAVGVELDRPLARTLARELRRSKALGAAVQALRSRPLSEQRLRERLRSRGVSEADGDSAVDVLSGAGVIDDARLARGRADALAERGWGDEAILLRLRGEGLEEAHVLAALEALEPEAARAAKLVQNRDPRKVWVLLQRRGFRPDTLEAALGPLDAGAAEGLG